MQQAPILRMYGITAEGNSVCAFLHGFEPYFFCKCADSRSQLSPDDLPAFQEALNVRHSLRLLITSGAKQTGPVTGSIAHAQVCHDMSGTSILHLAHKQMVCRSK